MEDFASYLLMIGGGLLVAAVLGGGAVFVAMLRAKGVKKSSSFSLK